MAEKDCNFFVGVHVQKHQNKKLWKETEIILETLIEVAKKANPTLDCRKYNEILHSQREFTSEDLVRKHFGEQGNDGVSKVEDYETIYKENKLLRKLIRTWNKEYAMVQEELETDSSSPVITVDGTEDISVISFEHWCDDLENKELQDNFLAHSTRVDATSVAFSSSSSPAIITLD